MLRVAVEPAASYEEQRRWQRRYLCCRCFVSVYFVSDGESTYLARESIDSYYICGSIKLQSFQVTTTNQLCRGFLPKVHKMVRKTLLRKVCFSYDRPCLKIFLMSVPVQLFFVAIYCFCLPKIEFFLFFYDVPLLGVRQSLTLFEQCKRFNAWHERE